MAAHAQMKKVYSSHSPFQVAQLKGVLEAHHIACITRNDFLQGAAGELPPIECLPELWILDESQLERASDLIAAFTTPSPKLSDWTCEQCGERLEGQFGSCWHCGHDRPNWSFSAS